MIYIQKGDWNKHKEADQSERQTKVKVMASAIVLWLQKCMCG